ncbi:uncharacterized protein LOC116412823 [Galleria mellonella]|uniref:Uncharacterized protein LOC116412823 n=1 Tax=Galleria mellonella TaxID=7137 RepID=A0A6J3BZN8_GALME|nr:uncharacterized protein LOC116412823 [Galleria mellonella]
MSKLLMGTIDSSLDVIQDDVHQLLERPVPAYSNVTVRRAFIAWFYCGQKNKFNEVCNYYHSLEAMEDTLSPEAKAQSRRHEFNMFSNPPPTSQYQEELFPNLYSISDVKPSYIRKLEMIKNEKIVFKLEGYNELLGQDDIKPDEKTEASKIIRKYCQSKLISIRKFLDDFKVYASRCQLEITVANIENYIKRKMLEGELHIVHNCPKNYDFLELAPEPFENCKDNSNKSDVSAIINNTDISLSILKPKAIKDTKVKQTAKIAKLNDRCAAFFEYFNFRHLKKSLTMEEAVSQLPLIEILSNETCRKYKKSKSIESLLYNKAKSDIQGLDKKFFLHFTQKKI